MEIIDAQLRIKTLESLIEKQSEVYCDGYHQARIDLGLDLEDVPLDMLLDEYRSKLYAKATIKYPNII